MERRLVVNGEANVNVFVNSHWKTEWEWNHCRTLFGYVQTNTVLHKNHSHFHTTCEMIFTKPKIPLFQLMKNTKQHPHIKSKIIKVYKSNCIPLLYRALAFATLFFCCCHVTVAQFMCTRNPRMDCACDDSCNIHSSHCMPLAFAEKLLRNTDRIRWISLWTIFGSLAFNLSITMPTANLQL